MERGNGLCKRVKRGVLVAREKARSRQAGENTEMATRHLVPFGAALRAGDPVSTGCGDDEEFHGALCLCG